MRITSGAFYEGNNEILIFFFAPDPTKLFPQHTNWGVVKLVYSLFPV